MIMKWRFRSVSSIPFPPVEMTISVAIVGGPRLCA